MRAGLKTLNKFSRKLNLFLKWLKYCFLHGSLTIKNEIFPYKAAFSKTNVKTNRMGSTKLTFDKEQCFVLLTLLFFLKI